MNIAEHYKKKTAARRAKRAEELEQRVASLQEDDGDGSLDVHGGGGDAGNAQDDALAQALALQLPASDEERNESDRDSQDGSQNESPPLTPEAPNSANR